MGQSITRSTHSTQNPAHRAGPIREDSIMNRQSLLVLLGMALALALIGGCMAYSSHTTAPPEPQAMALPSPPSAPPVPAPAPAAKPVTVNRILKLAVRTGDVTKEYVYTVTGGDFRFTTTDQDWSLRFLGKIAEMSDTKIHLKYDLGMTGRSSSPAEGIQIGLDGNVVLEPDNPVALLQDTSKAVTLTFASSQ